MHFSQNLLFFSKFGIFCRIWNLKFGKFVIVCEIWYLLPNLAFFAKSLISNLAKFAKFSIFGQILHFLPNLEFENWQITHFFRNSAFFAKSRVWHFLAKICKMWNTAFRTKCHIRQNFPNFAKFVKFEILDLAKNAKFGILGEIWQITFLQCR